jgi:hypothetical protein
MCLHCPNARRTGVHLPRLTLARDQAAAALDLTPTGGGDLPPPQRVALQTHIADLDRVISELQLHDALTARKPTRPMPDPPLQPHHDAFRRLADSRRLSALDRRLIDAFDRLAGGRSETTDGALTVTNLCAEARVSRPPTTAPRSPQWSRRSWPPTRHPVPRSNNSANECGNWTRPARSSGGTPRR